MYLKDPKTGETSVTLTVFMTSFGVAVLKLLVSGMQIGAVTLSPFTGSDFAAVVGAAGAIYWARRNATTGGSGE